MFDPRDAERLSVSVSVGQKEAAAEGRRRCVFVLISTSLLLSIFPSKKFTRQ